jgi:uncharacterized protein with von Willebrand factor type A (vWA) domain
MDVRPIAWTLLDIYGGSQLSEPIRKLNAAAKAGGMKNANLGKVVKETLLSSFYHPSTDPLPPGERGSQADLIDQLREVIAQAPAYDKLKAKGAYNMRSSTRAAKVVTDSLIEVLESRQNDPEGGEGGEDGGGGEGGEGGEGGLTPSEISTLAEKVAEGIAAEAEKAESEDNTLKMFCPEGIGTGKNAAETIGADKAMEMLDQMGSALPPHVLEMLGSFYQGITSLEKESKHDGLNVVGVQTTDDLERLLPDQLALLTHPDLSVRAIALAEFCDGEMLGTKHEDGLPAKDGDFTLMLDSSGSMNGPGTEHYNTDWDVAAALAAGAIAIAHRDGRTVRAWSFGGRVSPIQLTGELAKDAASVFNAYQGGGTPLESCLRRHLGAGGGDAIILTDGHVSLCPHLWKEVTASGDVTVVHIGAASVEGLSDEQKASYRNYGQAHWTFEHEHYYAVPSIQGDPEALVKAVAAAFNRQAT